MTPHAALTLLCLGLISLACICWLARLVIDAQKRFWRDRRDAAHFRRFCAACGGRESAFKVMDAAELSKPEEPVSHDVYSRGGKVVMLVPRYRDKREVKFTPDGSAA